MRPALLQMRQGSEREKEIDMVKRIERTPKDKQAGTAGKTPPAPEQVIYDGRFPMRYFHFSHGIIWLLLIGWNIGMVISWISSISNHVRVTTQRVVHTVGLISKHLEEVEFYRVKDTKFEQTVLQRIVGVGTVTLFSDDPTAPEFTFAVPNPGDIREKIRGYVVVERKRRRALQMD